MTDNRFNIRALMNRMKQYLHLDCMTCTGKTIGEEIEGAEVFDDSYKQVADRDDFEVTPDSVIILRNCGPKGGPWMPEWGMVPAFFMFLRRLMWEEVLWVYLMSL